MRIVPVLELGVWNAWILQVAFILSMFIPDVVLDREARARSKRMSEFVPLNKTRKTLALASHAVIMPAVFIYSIFLPLKIGTTWLYAGLLLYSAALVISTAAIFNIASTPVDEPVTKGAYRISRHPMYISGFLLYAGTGIACASWAVMLCAALWMAIWLIVVPAEERFLLERYGDSYRDYMKRTPRWIGIHRAGEKA